MKPRFIEFHMFLPKTSRGECGYGVPTSRNTYLAASRTTKKSFGIFILSSGQIVFVYHF